MGESEMETTVKKKNRQRKKLLYNNILKQMEFYFSDSNLTKDRFLAQLIQNDPYVDLSCFMSFNKIRKLTSSVEDIKKALRKSELLELSEDLEKVKRKTEFKSKENVDDCTIYVERISSDSTHDFLSSIFSDFGTVTYISIPKYKHNSMNKGFAFVEFDKEEEAENALAYFDKIGCKMSSNTNPEELTSITSYIEENKADIDILTKKRKLSTQEDEDPKKPKLDENVSIDDMKTPGDNDGKKKKKKENKRKTVIKEMGLKVLSKREWKKMRNSYLNLQRQKMKDLKAFLRQSKQNMHNGKNIQEPESKKEEPKATNLNFVPSTIVRFKLPDPCQNDKKLKSEIKNSSKDVLYVDIPISSGGQEVFLRFQTAEAALNYCKDDSSGSKEVLEGDEEKAYWEKIQSDREAKFKKEKKKQRGKDKLLKKTEEHLSKHTRFDDSE